MAEWNDHIQSKHSEILNKGGYFLERTAHGERTELNYVATKWREHDKVLYHDD